MSSNNITRTEFNALVAAVNALAEVVTAKPAKASKGKSTKPVTKPAARKSGGARKTTERKPASTTIEGKTCLVAGNRKQFIADHEWAANGQSVRQLCEAVLLNGQPLTGNWAIGPNRTRLITGEAPVAASKPAKKATANVAKVSASDDAKPCRRANGTIAPKGEWEIRRVLEAQGLDRVKVDKRTAKAMKVLG